MILSDLLEDLVVDSYSVRIPTYVNVSKKTVKPVNLNVYRNLHHHHLNSQKKNFADEVKPLLKDKPRAEKVWIHYEIFASRNGRLDTMNVGSIADKYFSDALVEAGKLPDDNQDHIILSTFSFGGVRPMDGHAIATVNILEWETEQMRILLDQDDIQAALNAYVKTLNFPNAETAEVELSIEDDEITAEVVMGEVKPKNKGGRPRKKPAPKKEEVKADEPVEDASEGSSDTPDSAGSESPADDTDAGEKESPAEDEKPKGKSSSKNLFGEEDDQSSASGKDTPTETPEKDTGASKVKTKKSSIFDVD